MLLSPYSLYRYVDKYCSAVLKGNAHSRITRERKEVLEKIKENMEVQFSGSKMVCLLFNIVAI